MSDYIGAGKGFGVTDKQHLNRAIKQIAKRDGIKPKDVDVGKARAEIAAADEKRKVVREKAEELHRQQVKTKREAAVMNASPTPSPANLKASLGDWKLRDGNLSKGLLTSIPVAGVVATLDDSSEQTKRITGTRVAAGAVLAGSVTGGLGALAGAALGGAAKKKNVKRTLYVTISFPAHKAVVIEVDPKDEAKARQFVATVNAAAAN
jgi:ABC-type molybdate transport system substrate-binding protein